MKKVVVSFLGLMIAVHSFASCNIFLKKKTKKQNKQTTSIVNKDNNIQSVLFGRAGCFGQCPTYTIEVFKNGLLRYTGKQYVPNIGVFEKTISSNKTQDFLNNFNTLQPDTLHYQYETLVADLPGFYFFISYPDSVKKVINADSGPYILKEWALQFDEFATADSSWKKVSEVKY